MDVNFFELQDACDPMLIGFPDLIGWGFAADRDDDGQVWIELRRLGVRLPCEVPLDA